MAMELDFIRSLRATRWFRQEPVTAATLTQILDAARWTGSARNRQPWRVLVVREQADRAAFARLGDYAQHLEHAPVVLLIALDTSAGEDVEFDGGRLAQSLMLAAHALGLGTCPATFFPEANAATATERAGCRAPWRVRTAISLGYPAPAPSGRPAIPQGRKSVSEFSSPVSP